MTALIAFAGLLAALRFALWLAKRDELRRHDRDVDDVLAARYSRPYRVGATWR